MTTKTAATTVFLTIIFTLPIQAGTNWYDDYIVQFKEFTGIDLTDYIDSIKDISKDITLPPIPKVIKDAKSMDVYKKKQDTTPGPKGDKKKELDYLFVDELYVVTKKRKGSDQEISTWLNTLDQGGSREGVYRALVLDQEYYQAEMEQNEITKDGADFTIAYMEKYLNQSIDRKKIEKINFYFIKREITERTLEVIDQLAKNRDDLHRWYAVFSSEFALKYPSIWTNKLRAITSAKKHYNWAQNVPIQHIKSEIIIKLHKIYNSISK